MKPTPSRTFYISLDPDEMLMALAVNLIDSPTDGSWRVDIQPGTLVHREIGLTPETPRFFSPQWHQNGNFYPPDAGYISELGVEAFFDQDELDRQGALFEPGEIENDEEMTAAHTYFREIANSSRLNEVIDTSEIYGEMVEYVYKIQWQED